MQGKKQQILFLLLFSRYFASHCGECKVIKFALPCRSLNKLRESCLEKWNNCLRRHGVKLMIGSSQEASIIVHKGVHFYLPTISREAKSDEKNPGTGDLQGQLVFKSRTCHLAMWTWVSTMSLNISKHWFPHL